jgi:hypothetical protein
MLSIGSLIAGFMVYFGSNRIDVASRPIVISIQTSSQCRRGVAWKDATVMSVEERQRS